MTSELQLSGLRVIRFLHFLVLPKWDSPKCNLLTNFKCCSLIMILDRWFDLSAMFLCLGLNPMTLLLCLSYPSTLKWSNSFRKFGFSRSQPFCLAYPILPLKVIQRLSRIWVFEISALIPFLSYPSTQIDPSVENGPRVDQWSGMIAGSQLEWCLKRLSSSAMENCSLVVELIPTIDLFGGCRLTV